MARPRRPPALLLLLLQAPAPPALAGARASVRLVLPQADLAQCATAAVNGGAPAPVLVQGGAVLIEAPLAEVDGVPMLVWSTAGVGEQ